MLEECWLHITDRCNLACRHCLFACSAKTRAALDYETIAAIVAEAYALGTRVFYLTGGEPLVHPDFQSVCRLILKKHDDTALVILTNGMLVPDQLDFFKSLPAGRLFLQISVDGIEEVNDTVRGEGTFQKLLNGFSALDGLGIETTLSMTVHAGNAHQMTDIVELAARHNIARVHYMWLLVTGKAGPEAFVAPDVLFDNLVACHKLAARHRVVIDNIRNFESQVFSSPGTKYDLGNAGWSSLAVGPDGGVYPTPALIGQAGVRCGHISEGLEMVWKNSPSLKDLRDLSLIQNKDCATDPLRFIVGGGDIDHSYYAGGQFLGRDPYMPLYRQVALWLMADSAQLVPCRPWPQVRRKMGEKILQCVQNGEGVALTHSNCVLTFASGTHQVVGDFYAAAASDNVLKNDDIVNPVCYPESEMPHIPVEARVRSYGCGSPVLDAGIEPGNVVVDLGSGAGVECYIAARYVGPEGYVIGVDMLDLMLAKANRSLTAVADNLGYKNVEFRKGFLEQLPLDDQRVDVIISNCVINLSEDKRRTFAEIFRVLKPGGRLFISDVATDAPCPPSIQNDAKLRGECISGALLLPQLIAILEAAGFQQARIVKRFFYRRVKDHNFYSITYTAHRPPEETRVRVMYPGPCTAAVMDNGDVLPRGEIVEVNWPYPATDDPSIFILDAVGNVVNIAAENGCGCGIPPGAGAGCDCGAPPEQLGHRSDGPVQPASTAPALPSFESMTDCMVCGKPLTYLEQDRPATCGFCSKTVMANAVCDEGHFVCDLCHSGDLLEAVKQICLNTDQTDMIDLFNRLRALPRFPMHGPEHHFALPGVIVATYRNLGGNVTDADIITAIDRGRNVPGGTCAFWGTCGTATGVGIAFGIILKSNPLAAKPRQQVQQAVANVINTLNDYEAARCCQREAWTALTVAAELSGKFLPVKLKAAGDVQCRQQGKNKECIERDCPYFKRLRAVQP